MRIALLDLETTGLDPATCRITELGAVIYDTDRRAILQTLDYLCELPSGFEIPAPMVELNGITQADCEEFGHALPDVLLGLGRLCTAHRVEWLCGHNLRRFDREFLAAEIGRMVAVPDEIRALLALPVIDTKEDLPFGPSVTSTRLVHLAAEHGFVNPFPHRALFDVVTTLRLLQAYPLDVVLARAASPTVTVYAHALPFDRKDEAKALRFYWDGPAKLWKKDVKELDIEALRKAASFEIRVVPAAAKRAA
jgi:DNA polymerase-3 subunit epsilon